MLHEAEYNQSKKMLLPVIEKVVEKMEKTHSLDAPWLPGADGMPAPTKPQCEYIVYAQLHPVPDLQNEKYSEQLGLDAEGTLREIEHEMRFPSGVSLPPPPPLHATAMIYSPNCGIVLLAENLQGEKVEPFYGKASHFALGAAAVGVVQLWLLIRQMNESNTLTTVCRVSFWTITMMAVVDGYLFFSFVFIAVFLRACFLPMVAASFCYLMLSAVHGMRFLVTTYRIQRQWRQPTSAIAQASSPAASDGLPAPVTAGSPAPANQDSPAITDEQVDAEIGALHTRFYFTLLTILFFSLNAATWPPFFRDILLCIVLLVINSYWIPQIYRNIMRGCRKAFQWEFVFGTSVCRLAGAFYILLYPDNIFRLEPNPKAVALICGWVWIQCVVLACQDAFGPRFLLPGHLLPPVYNYHSPLPADDEEAVQDMGALTDGGRRRSFNCVVCMQTVDVPTSGSADARDGEGSSGGVGLLSRRQYMVTPCRHVFHSHCLEGWMRFRLQCPICRYVFGAGAISEKLSTDHAVGTDCQRYDRLLFVNFGVIGDGFLWVFSTYTFVCTMCTILYIACLRVMLRLCSVLTARCTTDVSMTRVTLLVEPITCSRVYRTPAPVTRSFFVRATTWPRTSGPTAATDSTTTRSFYSSPLCCIRYPKTKTGQFSLVSYRITIPPRVDLSLIYLTE
jgi:hypothetical protein